MLGERTPEMDDEVDVPTQVVFDEFVAEGHFLMTLVVVLETARPSEGRVNIGLAFIFEYITS
jgi:hypothetical protein